MHGHGDGLEAWRTHTDTRHHPRRAPALSEVRLALWMKAEMLMPGERVRVYGRPGSKNPLLVSTAQRGRAFLGTETNRSTVRARPLDEKVSGATLVDWGAWGRVDDLFIHRSEVWL
jgi:predicted acyl esterase